jgi:hypothetical protein
MDSLVKVKDHKIENLISKLREVGMDWLFYYCCVNIYWYNT